MFFIIPAGGGDNKNGFVFKLIEYIIRRRDHRTLRKLRETHRAQRRDTFGVARTRENAAIEVRRQRPLPGRRYCPLVVVLIIRRAAADYDNIGRSWHYRNA